MHKDYKYMYNGMNNSCGGNNSGNIEMGCSCGNHHGGYYDDCEKYEKEAKEQAQEANKLKEKADHVKCEAMCVENKGEELRMKAYELAQEAMELLMKSEKLWEKHDKMTEEVMRLQQESINNLKRYIKCEEGDKPKPPHHGCGGCSCGCK